jgi:hypothetical protein
MTATSSEKRTLLNLTPLLPHNKQPIVIAETNHLVSVTALRHPFRIERISVELPTGGSVADMIRAVGLSPKIPSRVLLSDHIILAEDYARVFPKPGQTLAIRVIPEGGGNSKDSEILTIAVAAVAIAAGALIGNPQLGLLATQTSLFAPATTASAGGLLAANTLAGALALAGIQGAISTSINFLGGLAVNALVPPPTTPAVRLSSTPQSYTVSGTANSAAPFSPIPKIYGARRIFPQYAASPYTEVCGEDQYLRMLFLLGYGPLDISEINIADTAIEDYKDIEWELRAGFTDDAPSRLYPGSVAEQDFTIVLSTTELDKAPSLSGWMTQTSGPLADELSVDVTFPGGLNAFNSKGAPIPIQCTWQIQWAPAGTQNWTSEPDIVIKSGGVGAVRRGHVWRVPRGQYDVQMQLVHFALYEGDWSTNYTADGQWTALRTIRAQAPYTMAGLATLALRIRASRQLNGVISNLNCVASSILPDLASHGGAMLQRGTLFQRVHGDKANEPALHLDLDVVEREPDHVDVVRGMHFGDFFSPSVRFFENRSIAGELEVLVGGHYQVNGRLRDVAGLSVLQPHLQVIAGRAGDYHELADLGLFDMRAAIRRPGEDPCVFLDSEPGLGRFDLEFLVRRRPLACAARAPFDPRPHGRMRRWSGRGPFARHDAHRARRQRRSLDGRAGADRRLTESARGLWIRQWQRER